jgi:Mg-chelatase subunit ChlD
MTSPGKQTAKNAISSIKERGHTNLSGGLLAALQVCRQSYMTAETT